MAPVTMRQRLARFARATRHRAAQGMMARFGRETPGGVLLRRLMLPVWALALGGGALIIAGPSFGWHPAPFSIALASTMMMTALIAGTAETLTRMAEARERAEVVQRELTEHMGKLVEGISHGLFSLDHELRCTYVNRQGERILRRERRKILGQSVDALFPDAQAALHEAARRALAEGCPYDVEARLPSLDTWLEGHLAPADHGLTLLVQDVTDRRRRDEERLHLLDSERAARAEAERANRIKDDFLATVSHELRTPLNAILGWAQVLVTGNLRPGDLEQGLGTIHRNAQLQAQLIDDLLDVSRIVNGKLRLEVQPTELAPVIEAAINAVRQAAEAKGVRLEAQLVAHVPLVAGDAARLEQIVWNLLANAIKFTPRGGCVRVALTSAGEEIEIRVQDTGEGIEPEFLPMLFDRFRQADTSIRRKHGGLGLGLAIVRSLVEMHAGRVRAYSDGVGQGATFVVSLPALRAGREGGADRELLQRPELSAPGRPSLRGVQVLVVDDELDARVLARRILEEEGAAVVTAASAHEALDLLRRQPPHVLVTDIGMPGEDGYELLRRVHALEPDLGVRIPAVALTAFARDVDRDRALAAGFAAHLPKPVDPAELAAVISGLVAPAVELGRA